MISLIPILVAIVLFGFAAYFRHDRIQMEKQRQNRIAAFNRYCERMDEFYKRKLEMEIEYLRLMYPSPRKDDQMMRQHLELQEKPKRQDEDRTERLVSKDDATQSDTDIFNSRTIMIVQGGRLPKDRS